jgi:8-oxo-dGTP diphosphatase
MIEVSCALVIENGKVLATRRSEGMPHALRWEFPGGKLKEGENPERGIIREIREELGVSVRVDGLLPDVVHHYDSYSIRLIPCLCTITGGSIRLAEHGDYRWLACGELDGLDWLEADVEVVALVRDRIC